MSQKYSIGFRSGEYRFDKGIDATDTKVSIPSSSGSCLNTDMRSGLFREWINAISNITINNNLQSTTNNSVTCAAGA